MKTLVVPALGALLAIATGPAVAHEIYKWVDAEGVVHYADEHPENAASVVETLHIPAANPPDYDPAEAYAAIVAEAERIREELAELRAAREDEIARERARAAEAKLAELEARVAAAEEAAYAGRGFYLPFGLRKHAHFPRGHRPPPRRPPDAGPRPGWPGPGD